MTLSAMIVIADAALLLRTDRAEPGIALKHALSLLGGSNRRD